MRAIIFVVLAAGCASDGLKAQTPGGQYGRCPPETQILAVSPDLVTRGDASQIDVTWDVLGNLGEPVVATLSIEGDPVIEVDVPLALVTPGNGSGTPAEWIGSQVNPFGTGARAGYVSVLAHADATFECEVAAQAAASFMLE